MSYEKQLLGSILFDEKASIFHALKAGINEKSFTSLKHQQIWDAMMKLRAKGKPIESISVAAQIDKPEATRYCDDLIDSVTTTTSVPFYVQELRKAERVREAKQAMKLALESSKDNMIDDVIGTLIKINQKEDIEISKLGDLREGKIAQWKQAKDKGFIGVPFCIADINSYLGGWRQGCFSIIGGYRGEGKSTLARQDAYENAMSGRKVLFFSLEDPSDIAAASIAGLHSGVSTFHCDTGEAYDATINKIDNGWQEIADLPLWIISQNIGIMQMIATMEMLHMKHGLDIVYIDHIQFISPLILPGQNRTGTLAHYSIMLSGTAKKLGIPIVALSQLSRDSEKEGRKPRLSDLRDSGSLEQDARQVLLLCYDGEKQHHVIEVAKNNYGISGKSVDVWRLDGKHKFSQIEPDKKEDNNAGHNNVPRPEVPQEQDLL